jgi:hypothetical protein
MQELLFGPLLMTWGPPILAYVQQNPWRVFTAVLVAVLLMDLMLGKWSFRGTTADIEIGDGGGDGGGD